VQIARHRNCDFEVGLVASHLIGRHPSEAAVTGYFAAQAAVHYAVSSWLGREAEATGATGWRWALVGWQAITIGHTVDNVARNASIGLTPIGATCGQ
jgi:hypothetical protein